MILTFQVLRDQDHPALNMCDMIDFQVFTAALVILMDVLRDDGASSDREQIQNDWDLIHDVIREMKCVAETMVCSVAAQAAQLLQDFVAPGFPGQRPEGLVYEAVLPYFGKVRMKSGGLRTAVVTVDGSSSAENHAESGVRRLSGGSSEAFDASGGFEAEGGLLGDWFQPWQEQGVDWIAPLELDLHEDWSWSVDV